MTSYSVPDSPPIGPAFGSAGVSEMTGRVGGVLTTVTLELETGVPVANGILTTEDDDQALVRMAEKGGDCALVAVEMANLLKRIDE